MTNSLRELSNAELERIAGGAPIVLGGDADIPLGGGGRGSPYAPIVIGGDPTIPIIGGGRDWWMVPGDLSPPIIVPKPPEPGKP